MYSQKVKHKGKTVAVKEDKMSIDEGIQKQQTRNFSQETLVRHERRSKQPSLNDRGGYVNAKQTNEDKGPFPSGMNQSKDGELGQKEIEIKETIKYQQQSPALFKKINLTPTFEVRFRHHQQPNSSIYLPCKNKIFFQWIFLFEEGVKYNELTSLLYNLEHKFTVVSNKYPPLLSHQGSTLPPQYGIVFKQTLNTLITDVSSLFIIPEHLRNLKTALSTSNHSKVVAFEVDEPSKMYWVSGKMEDIKKIEMLLDELEDCPLDFSHEQQRHRLSTESSASSEIGMPTCKQRSNLDDFQQLLLEKIPRIYQMILNDTDNIKVSLSRGLVLEGPSVPERVLKQLEEVIENPVIVSPSSIKLQTLEMLKEEEVMNFVNQLLKNEKIQCHIHLTEDTSKKLFQLELYALPGDASKAETFITDEFSHSTHYYNKEWALMSDSENVRQEMESLHKEKDYLLIVKGTYVHLFCRKKDIKTINEKLKKMREFFEEQTTSCEEDDRHRFVFVNTMMMGQIKSIEKKFKCVFTPESNKDKQRWTIKGLRGMLKEIVNVFNKTIIEMLSVKKLEVHAETNDFVVSSEWQLAVSQLEKNFRCIITHEPPRIIRCVNENFSKNRKSDNSLDRQNGPGMKGRKWEFPDNKTIALYQGEARDSWCDVVVTPIQVTDFSTPQDKMKILNVPKWNGGKSREKTVLSGNFHALLKMAHHTKKKSIAIPGRLPLSGWKDTVFVKVLLNDFVHLACSVEYCCFFVNDQHLFQKLANEIQIYFETRDDIEEGDIPRAANSETLSVAAYENRHTQHESLLVIVGRTNDAEIAFGEIINISEALKVLNTSLIGNINYMLKKTALNWEIFMDVVHKSSGVGIQSAIKEQRKHTESRYLEHEIAAKVQENLFKSTGQ